MAFPLGWQNYFGFVCAPSHGTYRNIRRAETFSVSYPRPDAIVAASLAASPRQEDAKPIVGMLDTFPARGIDEVFAANSYLYLECRVDRIIDGFGANALIVGRITAAYVANDALRTSDRDDADVLLGSPHLVYLYPGRFAVAAETQAFPFPAGMRR
jgi:flavin reductase (DIM6/NTAB) family NADH-FMN oxidoreductase RutF